MIETSKTDLESLDLKEWLHLFQWIKIVVKILIAVKNYKLSSLLELNFTATEASI